jgi:hypothetical protein
MRSCCSAAARGAFCRVRRVRILVFPPCHAMPFSPGSYWPTRSYRYMNAMWSVIHTKCTEVPHPEKVGGRVHSCIHDIMYNRMSSTFARVRYSGSGYWPRPREMCNQHRHYRVPRIRYRRYRRSLEPLHVTRGTVMPLATSLLGNRQLWHKCAPHNERTSSLSLPDSPAS